MEYFEINNNNNNKEILLKEINNITNISYMIDNLFLIIIITLYI